MTNAAALPQSAPTGDGIRVIDLVVNDVPLLRNPDLRELMLNDFQARVTEGVKKYGTPLKTSNGRDALMDAYQETIDQAMYLRQWLEEHDADESEAGATHHLEVDQLYWASLRACISIRRVMLERDGA